MGPCVQVSRQGIGLYQARHRMSIPYFHVSPQIFLAGDLKPKGSYGNLLKSDAKYVIEDPHGEFLRESVRLARYPNKPSRLSSSFVFESLQDARTFRDRRGKNEKIYLVEFASEPLAVHRVCYTSWSMAHLNLDLQAHEFWVSPPLYDSDTELFAESDLIVKKEV